MSIRDPKGYTIREGGEVFRVVLDEKLYHEEKELAKSVQVSLRRGMLQRNRCT